MLWRWLPTIFISHGAQPAIAARGLLLSLFRFHSRRKMQQNKFPLQPDQRSKTHRFMHLWSFAHSSVTIQKPSDRPKRVSLSFWCDALLIKRGNGQRIKKPGHLEGWEVIEANQMGLNFPPCVSFLFSRKQCCLWHNSPPWTCIVSFQQKMYLFSAEMVKIYKCLCFYVHWDLKTRDISL